MFNDWLVSRPRPKQLASDEGASPTKPASPAMQQVIGGLEALKGIAKEALCGNLGSGWDFGPDEVLLQGPVWKKSRFLREWRPRWAVLSPRGLCTFAGPPEDISGEPTESLNLQGVTAVTRDGAGLTVHTAERDMSLQFGTQVQAEQWGGRILRLRSAADGGA